MALPQEFRCLKNCGTNFTRKWPYRRFHSSFDNEHHPGFFFNILSRVFKNEYELTRFQSLFLLHTTGIVYLGEDKVSLRSSGWLQTPWHVPVSASWELQGLLSHNTYVRTCSSFARIAWPSSFQLIWDSPGGRNVLIHKFHWTNKTVMPGPWMAAGRVRR